MTKLTLQEVFDKASKGMLAQNVRSSKDGPHNLACAYRSPDGKSCAIGFLIPDGHPCLSFSGNVWGLVLEFPDLAELFSDINTATLASLQNIHDRRSVEKWRDYLLLFAKQHNLEVNF